MSEKTITEEQVQADQLREVNPNAHWAYLFGVLLASTLAMVVFIA